MRDPVAIHDALQEAGASMGFHQFVFGPNRPTGLVTLALPEGFLVRRVHFVAS